ncbi:MAG: fibronectin type III domain-containing protein [Candidatus Bathyarchaeia archaeon]
MAKTKTLLISGFILLLFVSLLPLMHIANAAFTPALSSTAQTETTVTLSWTKSNDAVFYSYYVAYSTSINGPFNDAAIIANSSLTTFAVPFLTQNTTYYFVVKDQGSDGENASTSLSNICQANTKNAPTLFLIGSTSTMISLGWTDYNTYTSEMPFYGFAINMSTGGGQFQTLTVSNNATQNTYTVKNLVPGTSYQFLAYDEVGPYGRYQTATNNLTASTTPASSTPESTPTPTIPEFPTPVVLISLIMVISIAASGLTVKKQNSRKLRKL